MQVARRPPDEAERIKVLQQLAPAAGRFADIVEIARALTKGSIALVTLVESERLRFVARAGLDQDEAPRDFGFCAQTILADDVLWVEDASQDPRFWNNPLVVGPQSIRFYAGAPIVVQGRRVGAVSCAGCIPRQHDPAVASALTRLAALAAERLTARPSSAAAGGDDLLAAAPDAVVWMSETGAVAGWNPAAQRLFGLEAEAARGRSFSAFLAQDFSGPFAAAFALLVGADADEPAPAPMDMIGRRPDGREFPIELSLCAWNEGGRRRIGAIVRETARRIMAERALQKAKEQADAANRAKSEFLAVMSHEMRTPLNGVVALADVLSRTALTPDQREMIEIVRSAGVTLDGLVSDILDLARIESGAVEIKPEAFDLFEAVSTTVKLLEPKAREKGLDFAFGSEVSGPVRVFADPLRLRQIVNNLVANAIKSTDQGSVRAQLRRIDGAAGPTFEFTVEDTGPGLKPEDEGRIFERFEQADGGMTRRYGGTGLGLAISRELAGLMGGRLTCRNGDTGGSTFTLTLTLPVVEAVTPSPGEPARASAPARLGPRRVLLADDHPTNRKIVQLILSDPSLDLVAVENGAEAVERFKAERFDVVLMDMQMPVMNGLDATRAIRAHERATGMGETPVIMLTANAMPEHMEAARQAGCSRHLAKPITAAGLITAMGELFQAQAEAEAAASIQARRA